MSTKKLVKKSAKPVAKKVAPKKPVVKKTKKAVKKPAHEKEIILLDIELTIKKPDGTKELRTYKDAKAMVGFISTDEGIEVAATGTGSYFLSLVDQLGELVTELRGMVARQYVKNISEDAKRMS